MTALDAGFVKYTARTLPSPFENVTARATGTDHDEKTLKKAAPFAGK
jgi:hypothetical protein